MIWSLGGNYFHALSRSPNLFKKADQQLLCGAQLFLSLAREERAKQEWNKMTCVFLFFDKFIKNYFFFSAVGGRHSLLWTFNFTIVHRRSVSKPSSTPQALDARLHTLLYKRKENKKKNMKIKVIAIDSCTACITFCTEKPSTIFFFFFLLININSEWFEIHSQYNNSPCWVTQTKTRETRENNPTLVTA